MILSTDGITKKYNDLTAVDDVTWGVEEGQTKAVIGPNGAGKTTFFDILSGVTDPSRGEVRLRDREITDLALHEVAQLGIVKTFQVTNIFAELSVFENVQIAAQRTADPRQTYAMHTTRASLGDVDRRTQAILDRLALSDLADVEAAALSHGDQRKLEIGIGLATEPEVILLDEPTAGMSREETADILELLDELADDPSITIVITEHDIELILGTADVITVLHNGRLLAEGDADEIRNNDEVQRVYLGT